MAPLADAAGPTVDSGRLLPLALADDVTEGLVVIDTDSEIRYANPAMTRIFGYAREELEGAALTTLMPEEHRERHEEALDRYLTTGRRHMSWTDVELPGLHRDGHRLDLRISFTEYSLGGHRLFAGTIRDLTQAEGPEEEQRILAESYRALFEKNVAAVFRASPDRRIVSANGALAEMAGRHEPEELVGLDATDLFAEGEDREPFLRDLEQHREARNRELRLRREDGTTLWTLVNAVWIDDPATEEPEALVGTVVDVSDRKRVERELSLSEQRYRRLFEQDVAGVYRSETGPDGRIVECNEAFARIFGYDSREDVTGTPAAVFYPEGEDRQATVDRVRENGAMLKAETRLRRKDGSVGWGLAHARLVEDPGQGEILEGMVVDITDRVRARTALERAMEKFRGVFEISPVVLKVIDAETGEVLEVNDTFLEVFGYGRREVMAEGFSTEEIWEDSDRWSLVEERLRRGETVRNQEVRLRRKDGTTFDALYSGSRLMVDGDRMLVCAVQDISRMKEVERELEHRALHDQLTGLPNRTLFWDRMEQGIARAGRTGELVGVLFLDLDGFKRVNDELGHAFGDEVLSRLAARLEETLREQDTVARLGGDEFGLLLEDLSDGEDAREIADRLLGELDAPFEVAGEEILLDGSCGISLWSGDSDTPEGGNPEPSELLRQADLAMYAAKELPGSDWHRYGPEVEEREPRPLREEMRLRRGVEEKEFVPHSQPIVRLEDGRMVGTEALARWEDPERGLVSPGAFIPVAEETGLIVDLGHQVSRAAWRDFLRWKADGLVGPRFRLRVNLSARQLQEPGLVDSVEALLEDEELDPASLGFEVTESAAMGTAEVTARLQELGVGLSVDDFGTEYATLERLVSLDVDSLKVDRRFVSRLTENERHAAVVEASLSVADALGVPAVAEGVETGEQLARLRELGCEYAQGYLFARPAPADEFRTWLEAGRSWEVRR